MKNKIIFFLFCILCIHSSKASVLIVNGLTHIHQSQRGSTIRGIIAIENTGKNDERVLITQRDYLLFCDGTSDFTKHNSHDRSLFNWIYAPVTEQIIKAGETYNMSYEISFPLDQTLKGSYWTLFIVEKADPINLDDENTEVKIETRLRYGIQVIADIGDDKTSELNFENQKITKINDTNFIEINLSNKGIYMVVPTIIVEFFDENNQSVFKSEINRKKVYPESCTQFTLPIEKIPKGNYTVLLIADYGEDLYGANVELTIED